MVSALLLAQAGFKSIDGVKHLFAEKRPAVLVFALAECPILRGYVPELHRLAAVKGTRFFIVHVDPKASKADALAFNRTYSLPFNPVLDSKHALVDRFRVEAVPTAVVLDKAGRAAYVGRIDDRFPELGVQRAPRHHDLREALRAVTEGRVIARRTPVVGCAVPPL